MRDVLTNYYLQCMGIETWLLRQPEQDSCSNANVHAVSPSEQSCNSSLSQLAKEVASCTRCPLHSSRSNTVFARGNPMAKLMIIGEAPGFYEDKQGLPFVGKAGMLLNQMLRSIDLSEEDVYIANVLKCRPPNNRDPNIDEINQCTSYLVQQIALINPTLILAVGRFAGQFLVGKPLPLNRLRQQLHHYQNAPFMVSYHPAYLLRNPLDKKKAYEDLRLVKKFLMERQ